MQPKDEQAHPLYDSQAPEPPAPEKRKPGDKPKRKPLREMAPLTFVLAAINGLIFLVGFVSPELELELFLRGALIPQLVVFHGEVYRLFTAMFLHGGLGHVFFNVYALLFIGRVLEPIFGRARFLLIYLLGGLTGSALSLLLGGLDGASVGASGAVFAIFAAHGVHLYLNRKYYPNYRGQLQHMAFLIGMNLLIGFLPGSRIDNWGHIGGMLGGAWLSWRIGPRIALYAVPNQANRLVAAVDRNPLKGRWLDLAVYAGALVAAVVFAVLLLA